MVYNGLMVLALLIVPLFAYLAILILYRHNGKREVLKFDLVQFAYAFVILPIFFVWLKSFIYFIFKHELGVGLSTGQLFAIDTAFSLLFLYIFAFVVIHSLTKTFNLKHYRDPLYDLFAHSEYYHVWLSHVVMFAGGMLGGTLLSIVNLFVPLSLAVGKVVFMGVLGLGFGAGLLVFAGVWLADPDQAQFMRLMKLTFGFFFMVHVVLYFLFDPKFSIDQVVYWFIFMILTACVICSFFFERSKKAVSWTSKLKHQMWEKKLYVLRAYRK